MNVNHKAAVTACEYNQGQREDRGYSEGEKRTQECAEMTP